MKICLWVLHYDRQEVSVRARQDLADVPSVKLLNKDPQMAVHIAQQNTMSELPEQPCTSTCIGSLVGCEQQIPVPGPRLFSSQDAWKQAILQVL